MKSPLLNNEDTQTDGKEKTHSNEDTQTGGKGLNSKRNYKFKLQRRALIRA